MRRIASVLVAGVLAACASVGLLVVPASAGVGPVPVTTITVGKTVSGSTTGPFVVEVRCEDTSGLPTMASTLEFDGAGAPTKSTTDEGAAWTVVDGAWQLTSDDSVDLDCSFTETVADGATASSWTCDYQAQAADGPISFGCAAASGDGVGPVSVSLGGPTVDFQRVRVQFTNVIAPPAPIAVVTTPQFTG